ncbi:ATP-grasp domain-containing protein [Streptomyces physcomitrii]|uniref:carboxylate--amine ligase n=1 Tax=Streptomyces physcomitrii TaxID=2724184 RepID=UPI0033FC6E5B
MPQFDTRVPAVLLRIDRNPFHHGTLGAVRSLGRAGIDVHLVADLTGSPVGRSRHLRAVHVPPPPDAPEDRIARALGRLAGRLAHPAVLIPLDDASAVAIGRRHHALAGRFLLPGIPSVLPEEVADKERLAGVCARLGIPHPLTLVPADARQAAAAARRLGLPVVAKWSRPWLLPAGAGLRSTCLLRTPAEAAALFTRGARAGGNLLLQRYLPPGPGRHLDWFFHGYAARDGRIHGGGAGRKERSWPRGAGLTALGRWTPGPELAEAAGALVAALGYRGILDLDFRHDPDTGTYHLLDFNPRPGAQFRLFADAGGLDVVRAQHLDLTHRPLPAPRPRPGRVFVVENYAPLAALRPARGGRREGAWLAADDPLPGLALGRLFTRHAVSRLAARLRRALPPRPRRAPAAGTTALVPGQAGPGDLESAPRAGQEDLRPAKNPTEKNPTDRNADRNTDRKTDRKKASSC